MTREGLHVGVTPGHVYPGCQCAPTACGGVVVDSGDGCAYHSLAALSVFSGRHPMHWSGDCPSRGTRVGRRPKKMVGRTLMGSLRITPLEEEALILMEGSVSSGLRAALDTWLDRLEG